MSKAAAICVLAAALAGCASDAVIRDLRTLPQDCTAYLDPATMHQPLVPPGEQERLYARFRREFFGPWDVDRKPPSAEEVRRPFEECARAGGYDENGQKLPPPWAEGLRERAGLEGFPNRVFPAIAVRNTRLRLLPTDRPRFEDVRRAGYGYPFDTLQLSAVCAGSPARVLHVSKDGAWVLADAGLGWGWMPAEDLAAADEALAARWRALPLAAIVSDGVSVRDEGGVFRFVANLGAVFPCEGAEGESKRLLIPVAGEDGVARARTARVREAEIMPLPMTPARIAELGNRMLGQAYGWGGMYGSRDCSSTVRDLFAPFGLRLPRNSAEQARAGEVVPLAHLPPAERERTILQKGVPFRTLVRPTGHIMLYVGERNGRAIVLHNLWGLAVREGLREGRYVVGRCVLTTLQPGRELPNLLPKGDRRSQVESMVLVGSPGGEGP